MLIFFKHIYRLFCFARELVVSLIFILFVLACIALASFLSNKNQKEQPIFEKGALTLNLDGYLADNHDELSELYYLLQSEFGGTDEPVKISTFDVVQAIRTAQYDNRITGLVLDLSYFEGGDYPSLDYIGSEIARFKQSGKPVIAVGEYFSQQQYYLASFADKIYLNRAGFVDLHGLSYQNLYFKSLFEKIEAEPHIFRVGTYKSAVEPFIRDDMSPEARQNAALWLNQLWKNVSERVKTNRQLANATLVPTATDYIQAFRAAKGDEGLYALERKWVTELVTTDEMRKVLTEQFGQNKEGSYQHIDFFSYMSQLADRFKVNSKNKIAVINIEGEIVFGGSDDETAGSDSIVPLLRQARLDNDIQGVILRINSPGGSAIASELIRQEAEAIQKAGKPLVTSMGGMAASGGYWIAATSDKIIASPSTLTGSIGIFGLSVTFKKTAQKIGLNEDGIATSFLADQSELKPLSKEQGEIIQLSIENGYQRFLELVSRGRKMSVENVDKLAQGQVWLGTTAKEKGLIDGLGDFNDAYEALSTLINQKRQANQQAEIETFDVQWLTEEPSDLFNSLFQELSLSLRTKLAQHFNLPLQQKLREPLGLLSKFNDPKHSYLYCLNCGTVK